VYSNTLVTFTPGHFTPGKNPQREQWLDEPQQPVWMLWSIKPQVLRYPGMNAEETGIGILDSFFET
jgi:hypothetical protein